ncbi:phage holin, LLH family [Tindallia californiensis]|uniref:Bacteriophage holin of superfamily 6 (Holin_LLH) n=1 Tax=Tindallia californiensis TaxID=159292 RepID=A0A1H3R259_9FIRM|nr:phage holin, LLH family [Tindallia californiensis]SDZ19710.1 Bacteriophage holin of superfamily 6 (Holin_LLH) [Tindallia californiensis]
MIETIYTAIVGHVIEIFFLLLALVGIYAGKHILTAKGVIKTKLSPEQFLIVKGIAESVVLFVQQKFRQKQPSEKLDLAVEHAVSILRENGINVDENVLHVMIESNLKRLKKEFGDAWKIEAEDEP